MAAGIGPIGPFEALIILLVVVLIFGVGKLGDLGSALGKSVREFRRAASDGESPAASGNNGSSAAASLQTPPVQRFCSNCGHQLAADAKFCADCGAPVQTPVS